MADPAKAEQPVQNIRPVVRTAGSSNIGAWVFAAILLLGGLWLFLTLSANRLDQNAPRTAVPEGYDRGRITAPAPPALPGRFLEPAPENARNLPTPPAPVEQSRTLAPVVPSVGPVEPAPLAPLPMPPPRDLPEPARITFDRDLDEAEAPGAQEDTTADRVNAGRLANPSYTVPLGTVIPAVLESAIDSTRPGGVRALVQRDVYAFDGRRVLIQRGTRLYGEYDADIQQGQNRALIRWNRLLRPDGVTMALDSPASDPLGRAGVRGKVDSKFFQRFGGAILQSVLDVGVGLAVREATDGVIVALPGSTQNIAPTQTGGDIQPTLKVKHGTSVSVYVARDLDFSSVDQ